MCLFFIIFLLNLNARDNELNDITNLMKVKRAKYDKALELMKQAYKIFHELEKEFFIDSSDFFKALEYFQLKKYNKCCPIFVALIKKDEYKLECMFLLGESYFGQNKIKDASLIYNAIVIAQYDFFDEKIIKILKYSYLKLMNCFMLLGQKKDACAVMKKYVKAFPEERNNPEVHLFCKQNKCVSIIEEEVQIEQQIEDTKYLEDSVQESASLVVKTNNSKLKNLSKKKKKKKKKESNKKIL